MTGKDLWTTARGETVPISMLETQHLANIILTLAVNHGGVLDEVPEWPALRNEAIKRRLYPFGLEGGSLRKQLVGAKYFPEAIQRPSSAADGKPTLTAAETEETHQAAERALPGMMQAMAHTGLDTAPGAFYDTYKQVAGPMLKALAEADAPEATRAGLLSPHHLADFKRPNSWASIPVHSVDDIHHLEEVLRALQAPDAYSWIHPRGDTYIVPGRYNRDTVVTVNGKDPDAWICNCAQSHDTEYLCYPVLHVALLRGTLIRRTHWRGDA